MNFRLNYSFKKVDDYYNTSKVGELDIVTKASILYDQRGEPSMYLPWSAYTLKSVMPFMTYILLRAMPLSNGMRIWERRMEPPCPKLLGFILIFIRTTLDI